MIETAAVIIGTLIALGWLARGDRKHAKRMTQYEGWIAGKVCELESSRGSQSRTNATLLSLRGPSP
jgi:hypothetical protein